ncbi:Probable E3 ubiquitin-protein ligase RHB1A [Linum perenne]
MGGCCCCSSKRAELNPTPAYYYYPRVPEERVPLSAHHHVAASTFSTGLLVDTNLDTSVPDAYRPPPTPMPFDVVIGRPQTPPGAHETCANKNDGGLQATNSNSGSVQEIANAGAQDVPVKCEDVKEPGKTKSDLELDPVEELEEVEISKPVGPFIPPTEEEDCCPTCLEEYDDENPRIITKCEHHFHLACILEWMERSDTCPVCDKEMIFDPPIE